MNHLRKPDVGALLDRDHPLAFKLAHAWLLGGFNGVRDVVTPQLQMASRGTFEQIAFPMGTALSFTTTGTSGSRFTLGMIDSIFPLTPSATVVLVQKRNEDSLRSNIHVGASGSATSSHVVNMYLQYSDGNVYLDWAGVSSGTSRLGPTAVSGWNMRERNMWAWVIGSESSGIGQSLWINGILRAGHAGAVPSRTSSSDAVWYLGGTDASQGDDCPLMTYEFVYVYHRALTPVEIISLYYNPYQIFKNAEHPYTLIPKIIFQPAGVFAVDTATVTEDVTVRMRLDINVSDSITLDESVNVIRTNPNDRNINVGDDATLTESVTVALSSLTRSINVSDSVTLAESVTINGLQLPITPSVSSTIILSESVTIHLGVDALHIIEITASLDAFSQFHSIRINPAGISQYLDSDIQKPTAQVIRT